MKWRFWENPYIPYTTLLLDSESSGIGVALIHQAGNGWFILDDFFVEKPNTPAYSLLLNAALRWASLCGVCLIHFSTTEDGLKWLGKNNFYISKKFINIHPLIGRIRNLKTKAMPRKICELGKKVDLNIDGWYVTGIISQGVG